MSHNPWRLLTARGRAFVILGLIGTGFAVWFGQRDLAWISLLLFLLPLAAVLIVQRSRLSLSCDRRVRPPRAEVGQQMTGTLTVRKKGHMPIGMLRFEDSVPRELGRRPRFTVHQSVGEWERVITYPLMGLARGRHHVGPMLVRAVDPFGLAQVDRQFRNADELIVTPHIAPLANLGSAAGSGRSGESTPQRIGLVGQDDVLIREYRLGDDMRRVHWRSSAKLGELMVRREEQAWDPTASVLLDSRAERHAGQGRSSSFEWAVSAAASVCHHFIRSGFRVRLVDSAGLLHEAGREDPSAGREAITLTLTDEQPRPQINLAQAVAAANPGRQGELLIAVLGQLTLADAADLLGARRDTSNGIAIVLDIPTFASRSQRNKHISEEHSEAVNRLRNARWTVLEVRGGTPVEEAWATLEVAGGAL